MKLGIMQPYFLPYIGYWQLIAYVDTFVIYDDVTFIKGGWINRNRYLYQGEAKFFNIIMQGASSFKKINEIDLSSDIKTRNKLLSTISMAYKKAPMYSVVYPIIEEIILFPENNLARFIENSIRRICKYLEIDTEIIVSSEIDKKPGLAKEERVIDICKCLGADTYINAIGGQELYSYENFNNEGLRLEFLKTGDIVYKQFDNEFVPGLSILDIVMFNSTEEIRGMLNNFKIISQ